MFTWFGQRRSAVVIDVGAAGMRACQLRARGSTTSVQDALEVDTRCAGDGDAHPPAPVLDPSKLRRLVGQGQFLGDDLALVLSAPEVQFFPLHLAESALRQPEERICQALRFEVAQESRCGPDELELRYWNLPPAAGHGANVMAAVLRTATALEWAARLEAEGLRLRRIDTAPGALVRLVECAWQPEELDLWGILDIGLRQATITLVAGRVPVYVRSLSVSAHAWTRLLATAFEVPFPVAEQLQRETAPAGTAAGRGYERANDTPTGRRGALRGTSAATLPQAGGPTGAGVHGAKPPASIAETCASVLRSSMESLATETARCFSYGLQGFPAHVVRRLYLAGGGAELVGLRAVLEKVLELPVLPLGARTAEEAGGWPRLPAGLRFSTRSAAAVGAALLDLENE